MINGVFHFFMSLSFPVDIILLYENEKQNFFGWKLPPMALEIYFQPQKHRAKHAIVLKLLNVLIVFIAS